MRAVLVVLCVCAAASGGEDFLAECSNDETAVSMEAAGTFPGRYVVRYCTHTSPPITKWMLKLFTMHKPQENCTSDEHKPIHHGDTHSYVEDMFNASSINSSCPYVCFSRLMDLIFGSCYRIVNQVERRSGSKDISSPLNTKHLYIKNNLTKQMINGAHTYAECASYGDKEVCTWFAGIIPYTNFHVQLEPNTESIEDCSEQVTDNCTVVGEERGALRCELAVPPGAYRLWLRHTAPWGSGFINLVNHFTSFNYTLPSEHVVASSASLSAVWWSCGAVLLASLALLVALVLYHRRKRVQLKDTILRAWRQLQASRETRCESNLEPPAEPNPVLLLYARDCPPAQRAANALKRLISEQHGGQVLDLYEAATVARTAAAPAGTVSALMRTPHVRVVLLQTPAMRAVHAQRLLNHSLTLSTPLLGAKAVYSPPHPGDQMLQLALRLLQETSLQQPAPYRKYFLCTMSSVAVETFPELVPFTRFLLPHDAPALLLALSGQPAHPPPAPPPAPPPHTPAVASEPFRELEVN
ncbi:hypothetical protein O0L34_g11690 [Tuta absoluta]|nr:hypothetical protein O0L34_g11690 [Tuta absoluta]